MQKMRFEELTERVTSELIKLGYSDSTMYCYRLRFRDVGRYLESKGCDSFSTELGYLYLQDRYSIVLDDPHRKITKNDGVVIRVIRILDDYQNIGKVPRDYKRKHDVFDNEYHIRVTEAFDSCCAEAGYVDATLRTYHLHVSSFLAFVEESGQTLSSITLDTVSNYLLTLGKFKSSTPNSYISTLRCFFRFIHENGFCGQDLSCVLPRVKTNRQRKIPSIWTKEEVIKLLAAIDRNHPLGKRDYAMVLLVTRLGLRIKDVKMLRLSDIDWRNKTIQLVQSKTGQPNTLPLLKDIGWAIIDYINNARPKLEHQEVFLRYIPPYEPLGESNNLYNTFEKYIKIAHIPYGPKKKLGMHSMRHTLATHTLESHVPLPEISYILGHKNVESTAVYLKSGINLLKECCLDIEGDLNA